MRNCMITRNGNTADIFNVFDEWFGNIREETMKTDITENENGYEFAMAMPGFTKEEISVTLDGGYLTVSGKKEVTKVTLAPEVVDPDDIEMLQDLIMAAVNEAYRKVEEETQSAMSKYTGGLGLPF